LVGQPVNFEEWNSLVVPPVMIAGVVQQMVSQSYVESLVTAFASTADDADVSCLAALRTGRLFERDLLTLGE
jgi:hypothetical protein